MENQTAPPPTADPAVASSALLAALEEHISRGKVILKQINLPRYPCGGTIGIASASQIMRRLAEADAELMGLKAQLNYHEQQAANDPAQAQPAARVRPANRGVCRLLPGALGSAKKTFINSKISGLLALVSDWQ